MSTLTQHGGKKVNQNLELPGWAQVELASRFRNPHPYLYPTKKGRMQAWEATFLTLLQSLMELKDDQLMGFSPRIAPDHDQTKN